MWRPGFWGLGPALLKVRTLPFRDGIIGLCVVLYVGSLLLFRDEGRNTFAELSSPSASALLALGAAGSITTRYLERPETLLTAIFLHASILHIAFNLVWTWQLAGTLAELYDSARFLLIFLVSGLVGNIVSVYVATSGILIGASGGVYGLFGALVYYGFRRGGVFGANVFRFGLFWAGVGFLLSFAVPHCAIWAHVGGFVGGVAASAALGYQERRRSGPWICLAAVLAGLAVLAAFVAYIGFPPEGLEAVVRRMQKG